MTTTTTIRRVLTGAAVAVVLSWAGAGPAAAEYDGGSGPPTVSREGFVDDADLVHLRTGMGAGFALALGGAAVVGLRHRLSRGGGGPPDKISHFHAAAGAGLA